MIPLEPRFMFDAAGVATGAEVAAEAVAQEQAEQAVDNLQEPPVPAAGSNTFSPNLGLIIWVINCVTALGV